jgi:hypothetical protein
MTAFSGGRNATVGRVATRLFVAQHCHETDIAELKCSDSCPRRDPFCAL